MTWPNKLDYIVILGNGKTVMSSFLNKLAQNNLL